MTENFAKFVGKIEHKVLVKRIVGVIKKPSKTFKEIEEARPIEQVISFLLILTVLDLVSGTFSIPIFVLLLGIIYSRMKSVSRKENFIAIFCMWGFAIIPGEIASLLIKILTILLPLEEGASPTILIAYIPAFLIVIGAWIYSLSLIWKYVLPKAEKFVKGVKEERDREEVEKDKG